MIGQGKVAASDSKPKQGLADSLLKPNAFVYTVACLSVHLVWKLR